MIILEKNAFKKAAKKLHKKQRAVLERAVLDIVRDVKKGKGQSRRLERCAGA